MSNSSPGHPSNRIRGTSSRKLDGYRIVVGITGSISAVEMVRIIREIIRHGADVHAVMSPEAERIVTVESIQFATGNRVVTALTGDVEHVSMLHEGERIIYLIAPATANTIGKIACGIDDTPPTSFATVAIGAGTRIVIAPAMHSDMLRNPIVMGNIVKLKGLNIDFVFPSMYESEAKLASAEEIVDHLIMQASSHPARNRKVLVIGGSSRENIDDVRYISNRSTGKTALALAREAFYLGGSVTLFYGHGDVSQWPSWLDVKRFSTVADLKALVESGEKWDLVLVPAALSDFTVDSMAGKIPSEKDVSLHLRRADKILPLLREKSTVLVGFKAEWNLGRDELIKKGKERIEMYSLDMIVANNLNEIGSENTHAYIISRGNVVEVSGSRADLAGAIFSALYRNQT